MLIGLSFNIREAYLRKEIAQKNNELRGVIYNLLNKEINLTGTIPSLSILKKLILQGVNRSLSTGKIDGVYIEQYLAV
jgi:hypothetical protein